MMEMKNILKLPKPQKETEWQEYFRKVLDHHIIPDRPDPMLPGYFRGVLDHAESSASNPEEIAEALYHLAVDQRYTNTPLDDDLRRRVELWIQKAWNPTSEILTRKIVGVVGIIDLPNSLQLLKQALQGELPPTVRPLMEQVRPVMDIKKIARLPDSIGEIYLRAYFREVLEQAESSAASTPEEIAKALSELSVRQWHTYTLLDDDLRRRIELWIQKAWDPTSEILTRKMVGIVGTLGLRNSLQLLKQALKGDLPPRVRADIEGGIRQFGGTIDDPYAGMRQFERK